MASGALAAEYASQVFRRLLERSQERLSRGAQLRAAMAAQIAAGITPTGYRAEFLHESSTKVIALLGTLAEQFNAEHGDDLVSLNDLLDILNTAKGRLVKAAHEEAVSEPLPA